jgi:uracil-DNA glycosylase
MSKLRLKAVAVVLLRLLNSRSPENPLVTVCFLELAVQDVDRPRSLKDAEVRARRIAMLQEEHIGLLTDFVADLNKQNKFGEVPWFDPLDGGINAQVLFLLEKPGPMTSVTGKRIGSGFISRNNNDSTAEATFRFMHEANLPRTETCMWNTIPGWNGKIPYTSNELRSGFECLYELFSLLPRMKVIVLVGLEAQKVEKQIQLPAGIMVVKSYHPSPHNRRFAPEKWSSIPQEWAKIAAYLKS